jgi:hypothetical protein
VPDPPADFLLGIHPHHLHFYDSSGALADQPVRILIDLARQLDIHPTDLVPALEPLLGKGRAPQAQNEPTNQATTLAHGDRCRTQFVRRLRGVRR